MLLVNKEPPNVVVNSKDGTNYRIRIDATWNFDVRNFFQLLSPDGWRDTAYGRGRGSTHHRYPPYKYKNRELLLRLQVRYVL
jgi:hypothetical protein